MIEYRGWTGLVRFMGSNQDGSIVRWLELQTMDGETAFVHSGLIDVIRPPTLGDYTATSGITFQTLAGMLCDVADHEQPMDDDGPERSPVAD